MLIKGKSIVIAGEHQPVSIGACDLAHAINAALGNVGSTVVADRIANRSANRSIRSLRSIRTGRRDLNAGKVEALVIDRRSIRSTTRRCLPATRLSSSAMNKVGTARSYGVVQR